MGPDGIPLISGAGFCLGGAQSPHTTTIPWLTRDDTSLTQELPGTPSKSNCSAGALMYLAANRRSWTRLPARWFRGIRLLELIII